MHIRQQIDADEDAKFLWELKRTTLLQRFGSLQGHFSWVPNSDPVYAQCSAYRANLARVRREAKMAAKVKVEASSKV
jgi:hypothetical protein